VPLHLVNVPIGFGKDKNRVARFLSRKLKNKKDKPIHPFGDGLVDGVLKRSAPQPL
jgi:hypothetical protein